MATRILKFPLQLDRLQELQLPKGAGILSVAVDGGFLCLYAAIDPEAKELEPHLIEIIGSGQDLPETALVQRHIGTVTHHHLSSGSCFCWHVFERMSVEAAAEIEGPGIMTTSNVIEKLFKNQN